MRKIAAGVLHVEVTFWPVVVAPADTVTLRVATASSFWYSVSVYVPGFIAGLEKLPVDAFGVVQYCACALAQPTSAGTPAWTPDALPATKPRPDTGTAPRRPRPYMNVRSGVAGAGPLVTISAYGPYST